MERTSEEIVERVKMLKRNQLDFFGFQTGDLIEHLDLETAQQFLSEEVTQETWDKVIAERNDPLTRIKEYFPFAYGKCIDHRGLSADRSIQHYQAWTWLLDNNKEFEWDIYANYGAPILKHIAGFYEIEIPDYCRDRFDRMALGLECREDECDEGCGR